MKKLMIALGAVVAAATLNAAVMNWSSGAVKLEGVNLGNESKMYVFSLGQGTSDAFDTLYSAWEAAGGTAEAMNSTVWGEYKESLASADFSDKFMQGEVTLTDSAATKSKPYYAAIVITHTDGTGAIDYYMCNLAQIDSVKNSSEIMDLGVTLTGYEPVSGAEGELATAWTSAAVPEPTSGLLLLLGIAGLALKRRRA